MTKVYLLRVPESEKCYALKGLLKSHITEDCSDSAGMASCFAQASPNFEKMIVGNKYCIGRRAVIGELASGRVQNLLRTFIYVLLVCG